MIITDEMVLAEIDAFLTRTKMAPTRLGIETLGDGGLVKNLREGRSLSVRNAEKVFRFIQEFAPEANAKPTQEARAA